MRPPSLPSAQTLYGSIVGNVRDTSGAAVPGSTVTISEKQTGLERTTVSNETGSYSFTNALPGIYDVKVSLQGFKEFVQTDVPVSIGQISRVDVSLELGALTETITVASDSQLLQTDKATVSTEIKSKELVSMPLNQFRNYQALINLVPGASPAAFQNAETDTPSRSLATWVNGQSSYTNSTRTDGATNVNIWLPNHQMLRVAGRDDRHGEHLDQQLRRRAGHGRRRRDHGHHQVGHQRVQGVGVRVLQQREAERERPTTSAATARRASRTSRR